MPTWWDSTSALGRINTWTQVATVVFGILVASATALKIVAANRLSTLQSARSAELAARLAAAESNTTRLNDALTAAQAAQSQDVSRLQAELDEARRVAAAAAKAAASASARVAPRTVTAHQASTLLAALQGPPQCPVDIVAVLGDGEALSYATQLSAALSAAGWKASEVSQAVFTGKPVGIILLVHNQQQAPPAAARLQQVLSNAGIHAPGEVQEAVPPQTVKLIVGHKQ